MGAKHRPNGDYEMSSLRESTHGMGVNRDYMAHYLRWSWVTTQIRWGDKVFDFGCGEDSPLYDVISKCNTFTCRGRTWGDRPQYTAVDISKLNNRRCAVWADVHQQVDILTDISYREKLRNWGDFDIVVSFEVIEHMTVEKGDLYLDVAREAMADHGRLLLSTPVFNGKAAKNHVHEYTIDELADKLADRGFKVIERWGTFASWNDIRRVATEEQRQLLARLQPYLGKDVVSHMLAPLYPDASRNNVWVCVKA